MRKALERRAYTHHYMHPVACGLTGHAEEIPVINGIAQLVGSSQVDRMHYKPLSEQSLPFSRVHTGRIGFRFE
jgi:hypothetical protein